MTEPLVNLPVATEVCERFPLSAEATAILRPGMPAREFALRLTEAGLARDVIQFAAYVMPPRPAVWWGLLCVWDDIRPEPTPEEQAALTAALRWVQDPVEERRRGAYAPGKAVATTPAGQLALASFWSSGSMAPPEAPEVKAPPFLTQKTVAGAVLIVCNQGDPKLRIPRLHNFIRTAGGVAQGAIPWK